MAPTKPQSEEQPVKRGRGRPPKDPSERKTVPKPSGRPRGRPKGSGGVKKAPQKTAASTVSRRGRPPKSAATPVAAKKAAAPKATPSSTGRGRGRPRKSDVSEAATPSSEKATPKKGGPGRRGRPPKAATEQSAEEEDGEEAVANEEDADEADKVASDAASDVDEAASDENNNFKDAFGDVDMTLNGLDPGDIEATGEEDIPIDSAWWSTLGNESREEEQTEGIVEESEEEILDCIVVALSSDPPEPPWSSQSLFLPPGTPEPPSRTKQEHGQEQDHSPSSSFSSSFCDYSAPSTPSPRTGPAPDESDQEGEQAEQDHVKLVPQPSLSLFVEQPASSPKQDTVANTGFKRRSRDDGLESAGLGCVVS